MQETEVTEEMMADAEKMNEKFDNEREIKRQLFDAIDYIKKANENIIQVNEVGGEIIHEGIGLKGMRSKIEALVGNEGSRSPISDENFNGQKEEIIRLLKEIAEQNLSTGYDSDLINNNVLKIEQMIR